MAYSQSYENLKKFLVDNLAPYPDVHDVLVTMTNGTSSLYHQFHDLSTKAHVGLIHVRHRGMTYQISRTSNVRNTAGYERYMLEDYHENKLWKDEPNVACKFFRRQWEEWFTIRLLDK